MTLGEVKKSHQVTSKRWLKIQIVFRKERGGFVLFPLVCFKGHRVRLNFGGPSAYWMSIICILKDSSHRVLTF